jgi:serine/threonine protein kinase
MGVVYEAEDTRLPRHVALKFLSQEPRRGSPRVPPSCRAKPTRIALLTHPNICTIYEYRLTTTGVVFIAMERRETAST